MEEPRSLRADERSKRDSAQLEVPVDLQPGFTDPADNDGA